MPSRASFYPQVVESGVVVVGVPVEYLAKRESRVVPVFNP